MFFLSSSFADWAFLGRPDRDGGAVGQNLQPGAAGGLCPEGGPGFCLCVWSGRCNSAALLRRQLCMGCGNMPKKRKRVPAACHLEAVAESPLVMGGVFLLSPVPKATERALSCLSIVGPGLGGELLGGLCLGETSQHAGVKALDI